MTKIRVLIVDDQAIVRDILSKALAEDNEIQVVGAASNPYVARDMIVTLRPDVLTLDVEMPLMNGIDFLRKLMPQYPLPVVMVSSLTQKGQAITLEALKFGAVDVVAKPDGGVYSLQSMIHELRAKIREAAQADLSKWFRIKRKPAVLTKNDKYPEIIARHDSCQLIAFGASTGGTSALREILMSFPVKLAKQLPPMVVVQHMPAGFTASYAKSLDKELPITVKEAENGDMLIQGRMLIAPGDYHLAVVRYGSSFKVNLFQYEKINGHRPSVDALFDSISQTVLANNAIGVLLTGMGSDGAKGLQKMRQNGAKTIGQDESTCIVYGMPKMAMEMGAVQRQLALPDIAQAIVDWL